MRQPAIDYDPIAREYGNHRRPHPGVIDTLVELASAFPNPRVLEIGVGTGNIARALGERVTARMVGVDPSSEMLAQARNVPGLQLSRGRAETLPFASESFDMAYSADVIHHIGERDAAATEAFRVVRPGGMLAIATDSEEDIQWRVPLASHFPETVAVERARYPTITAIRDECLRSGFRDIQERHVVFRYAMTNIQPYRDKAFSSLHLISAEAVERGLARIERDLAAGGIAAESHYTIVFGRRPG